MANTLVHRFFNHPGLRRAWVKSRYVVLAPALALWMRYADTSHLWVAFGISLAGELIQLWCFATLDKRRTLAFNGPYRHVRNPMYLGRYLLSMGYLVPLHPLVTLPLATLAYGYYMVNRVRREEAVLRTTFGAPYEAYCRRVDRFLPGWKGMEEGRLWMWDWKLFRQNHGPANLAGMLGSYALLAGWSLWKA